MNRRLLSLLAAGKVEWMASNMIVNTHGEQGTDSASFRKRRAPPAADRLRYGVCC